MTFLPDPQRQSDVKFLFFKKLSYMNRIYAIICLYSLGGLIQLLINFWVGLCFLFLATLLGLIKGYADKPKLKRGETWAQVTPDEYKKVKDKQKQLESWDRDCFDITNPLGLGVFVLISGVCFVVWLFLATNGYQTLARFWLWDIGVILAPHWLTGTRSFLKKDQLIIKISLLEDIMQSLVEFSEVQVLPMLSTRQTQSEAQVPIDARLMVKLVGAGDEFLGMQVQVSINSVQGTDYPYLYCVLIAKPKASLFKDRAYKFLIPKVITVEITS